MMPVMDGDTPRLHCLTGLGITATMEIRKWEAEQKRQSRIPIIALTAHAMLDGL